MMFTRDNEPVHIGLATRQALIDIRKRMEARRVLPTWNLRHRDHVYARIEAYRQYFNALRSSPGTKERS